MRPYFPVFQLSFAAFFAALHFFLIAYMHSSMISARLGEEYIAPLFAVGSLLSIAAFLFAPRLLRLLGARGFLALAALCEGVAILALIGSSGKAVTISALLAHLMFVPLIALILDLFLEQATASEELTGNARGIFFTATNTALVISPPLMGLILTSFSFEMVYLASIAAFLAFLASMIPIYRHFEDPSYHAVNLAGMRAALACADIAPTALANLSLRIFYAIAAVYIPLYLYHLGFAWSQVGLILGIALLPFALATFPAGRLADSRFGEKEIMVLGFSILGVMTAVLALPLPLSVPLYAGILFMTRVGAALVEITTETHFFRSVTTRDTNSITLFRMLQPFGYILGVSLAALLLTVTTLHASFFAFAVLVLALGVPAALRITDFR